MSAAISMQAGFWLYAAALGAVLLFLYDLLRIFRRVVPHGAAAVGIEDFVYWLVSGCLIFAMLYRFNNGIIRWFAVFGMLVGMLLYHLTVSRAFVKYASRLLKYILQILRRALRLAKRIVRGILRRIQKAFRYVGRFILRLLSPPFRFVSGKIRALSANMNKRHKKSYKFFKKRLKSDRKEGKMRQEARKGSDTVGKEQKRPPKRTPQRAPRGKKARQPQQTE